MARSKVLRKILKDKIQGATFLGLDTVTEVILPKSSPHHGRTVKVTLGSNVMVFQNKRTNAYENMVKRRLVAEGKDPNDFVLSPRKWGVREVGTPFVTHNEAEYLEVIFMSAGDSKYYVNGVETPRNQIIGLKPAQEAEQGGLEGKVILRTYAVESIVSIVIDGERFEM